MERVDMVLLGCEAVVESGALVSSVGTYQLALIAKAMQKPVFALAESYKFLRHYPLSQTDLPMPRDAGRSLPLSLPEDVPTTPRAAVFETNKLPQSPQPGSGNVTPGGTLSLGSGRAEMTKEMEDGQPLFDVTYPELIDFIITDLGTPLSPTSVSQYLVAMFSE